MTPPSRLVDRVAFSQAPPWRVVRCKRCGLVYRNPAESRDAVRATYAGELGGVGVAADGAAGQLVGRHVVTGQTNESSEPSADSSQLLFME